MVTSLKEYLPAVVRGVIYTLGVGAVSGVVGWVFDLDLVTVIPSYGWVLIIAVAFAIGQFQAFHKVRVERDAFAPEKAKADLYIRDAYEYIRDRSKWAKERGDLNIFRELRQAATDGDVWIWGRHYTGGLGFDDDKLLDRIQRDYWKDHGLDETVVIAEREEVSGTNMTRDEHSGRPQELYSDLHLNKVQVRRRWPPK